jgi:transcriptional regulator with XRE-family HTH domain
LDFGAWLAQRRKEADLTLRELAKRSKLSLPYVAALERGTSEAPPLPTCKSLARALGIDWKEVWRLSFAARLKRWLKQQGHSGIPEGEFNEIVTRIQSSSR